MKTITEKLVHLEFYKPKYRKQLEQFFLPEEQLQYTSLPIEAIEQCNNDKERYPIVILYKDIPAGFFVLHGWDGVKAYSDNRHAILLRAYSINHIYQGKGIAKKSLQLLPSFVNQHFPDKNEIILAVNKRNIGAQEVYKKGGFEDSNKSVMGKKGELFIFQKSI